MLLAHILPRVVMAWGSGKIKDQTLVIWLGGFGSLTWQMVKADLSWKSWLAGTWDKNELSTVQ